MPFLIYVSRLLREVWWAHLWAPLLVTVIVDTTWGRASGEIATFDWASLQMYWSEHLVTLVVHYITFLVVFMALLGGRASPNRVFRATVRPSAPRP